MSNEPQNRGVCWPLAKKRVRCQEAGSPRVDSAQRSADDGGEHPHAPTGRSPTETGVLGGGRIPRCGAERRGIRKRVLEVCACGAPALDSTVDNVEWPVFDSLRSARLDLNVIDGDVDILRCSRIVKRTREHIIPEGLGGRLTSTTLLDAETNNELGSTIERRLLESLRFIRVLLGLTSRRGKELTLEPSNSEEIIVGSHGKPKLRRPNVDRSKGLRIEARSPREALSIFYQMKRGDDSLTLESAELLLLRDYVDPVEFDLEIDSLCRRAVAMIAFEFLALHLPREVVSDRPFDHLREWIVDGIDNYSQGPAHKHPSDLECCVFHGNAEVWQDLPGLDGAPFQHRVFVWSGANANGAFALMELFGHFRFVCRLSREASLPQVSAGHAVDPCSGRTADFDARAIGELSPAFAPAVQNEIHTMVSGLMRDLTNHVDEHSIDALVEEAILESFPAEGEMIMEEHLVNLRSVAQRFAAHQTRSSTEIRLSADEFKKIASGNDDPSSSSPQ